MRASMRWRWRKSSRSDRRKRTKPGRSMQAILPAERQSSSVRGRMPRKLAASAFVSISGCDVEVMKPRYFFKGHGRPVPHVTAFMVETAKGRRAALILSPAVCEDDTKGATLV